MTSRKDLKKIAEKYNLQDNVPELSFAVMLDELLGRIEKKNNKILQQWRKKKEFLILDIGSGYFKYGNALEIIMKQINNNTNIFTVDKKRLCKNYEPATFLNGDVNDIAHILKKNNVQHIDLFTVFNPFPGIPDFRRLKQEIGRDAALIGCVDWNQRLFKASLEQQGYKPIIWQKNYLYEQMRPWFNSYSIFVFGVKK